MGNDYNKASHDPFNIKYVLVAVLVALALPLMHVLLGISVFLN